MTLVVLLASKLILLCNIYLNTFLSTLKIKYNSIFCNNILFLADTTEPDINDVNMAFRDKDVSIPDLVKYLKQSGPVEFPHLVPKFPIPTNSNLNIMKPGSREIVTRPVCVHEHLPTMYPEQSGKICIIKLFIIMNIINLLYIYYR